MILVLLLALTFSCPAPSPPILEDPCHGADVNCDFAVNILDVIDILLNWGGEHESCDINDDNSIDVLDLIIVLDNWGCCNVC